jgi:ubiquinone/menaquinone biosynthesis C-methylase UbiE
MTDSNARFDGSIPANYDRYLGPLLFEPYAADLVARLTLGPDARVVEVAAGTGILTRRLREQLPASATLVATDLNQPMLEYARGALPAGVAVDWRQADAVALPAEKGTINVVACQFGVMFFPDKPAAFGEARRVLRRGGTYAFNVWGALGANPLGRIAHETIATFFPTDPPDFYTVPFGFHDRGRIQTLLRNAAFTAIKCEVVKLEGVSPSARDAATGLVLGNPVLTAIQQRGTVKPEVVVDAIAAKLASEFGERDLRVPMEAQVWVGRAG